MRLIDPATMAHIHVAPSGAEGPIDEVLNAPSAGYSSGCVEDPDLVKDITENPEDFYVNVHDAAYPQGALRGQLG